MTTQNTEPLSEIIPKNQEKAKDSIQQNTGICIYFSLNCEVFDNIPVCLQFKIKKERCALLFYSFTCFPIRFAREWARPSFTASGIR